MKGSWLVDLGADGLQDVQHVPAPVPHRLSTVRGTFDELLTSRAFTALEQHWLTVVYTDAVRPDDAMARLSVRFPHVLVLRHEPVGLAREAQSYGARVAGRSDVEVAAAFVEHVRRTALAPEERLLLEQALEAGRLATAGA